MALHLSLIFPTSQHVLKLLGIFALCGALSACNEMGDEIASYAKDRKAAQERSANDARQKALIKSANFLSPGESAAPSDSNSERVLTAVEQPHPVKVTLLREPNSGKNLVATGFVLPTVVATEENAISLQMTGSVKK